MKVKCKHAFTLTQPYANGFGVSRFTSEYSIPLPNGKEVRTITVKGYNLPNKKAITYELEGEFESYNKNGKENFTFKMKSYTEIIPTDAENIKSYLVSLDGVGEKLAERLFHQFGKDVFNIIQNEPDKLTAVKGVSKPKAKKIQTSFMSRAAAKELFDYLGKLQIPSNKIMKLSDTLGQDALCKIKNNPFCITQIAGIGFKTADYIANKQHLPSNSPERIKAGILEVLSEGEHGGRIFNKNIPYPKFMLNQFLSQNLCDLLYKDSTFTTGGTYLTRDTVYLMTLKLLDTPLSETEFDKYLYALFDEKKIFMSYKRSENSITVYRHQTAYYEYSSAKKAAELLEHPLSKLEKLDEIIQLKQKELGILLSCEQREAVYKAMTSPISVITGGPGTGKTSILKVVLAVYQHYFPNNGILLASPTGKAAKRMSEQTKYNAYTLHTALKLFTDEEGNTIEMETSPFRERLIIIDEASMMGAQLFSALLSRVAIGTRLVLVGDVSQLPSIEVGSVLRELILSKSIPTTELTITFRQASGSKIITNAATIKNGAGSATYLEYGDDYQHIEKETSTEIAEEILQITPKLVREYRDNEVMVLTAYRRFTESGADAINEKLRSIFNPHNENDIHFTNGNGVHIYEGDKIMNTVNSELLTNGDIGHVKTISKTENGLIVTCEFDGEIVALEGSIISTLDLAYAMTVHKAQGSEAKCVVMICDLSHKLLLKRNLLYTGITRGKEKIITVGQKKAIELAMKTEDAQYRLSSLSDLIDKYHCIKLKKNDSSEEQLKMCLE